MISGALAASLFVAASAIATTVVSGGCSHKDSTASGSTGAGSGSGSGEGRVVTVQVAPVEKKDMPIWLEGLGTVAALQQVTVRPQVDGKIDKVLFTEGQMVKRGDVLMQIDARPFVVTLHQAQGALARDKAQLVTNQANLKRYQGLLAQNLVASQQVEEVAGTVGQYEGTVKVDQATIESALLQLDYAQVKSPIDGITGVRQVDAGNLIHQTDTNGIVVVTQIDPAAVFFTVPQDELGPVAAALAHGEVPVEVMSRDGTTKLATGKLAVLDNQINQTTATLRLKAVVPNPNRILWPNAFVKARMLVETRKDAIVIPTVAVQRGPQGTYVYAVGDDKTAQMKPVTVELTTGELSVISKGLAGGERVIIEGQNQVRPGGKVEPAAPGGGQGPGPGAGSASADGHGGRGKRGRAGGGSADGAGGGSGTGPGTGTGSASPAKAAGGEPMPAAGSGASGNGGTAEASGDKPGSQAARPDGQPRSRESATGPTASNQPAAK